MTLNEKLSHGELEYKLNNYKYIKKKFVKIYNKDK